MAVRRDVNVRRSNIFQHLLGTDEPVVEENVRFHSDFPGQSLQMFSIAVTLAAEDVRVGRARDQIDHILVSRQNFGQRLNDVLNSFVRREQAEGEQDRFSFHPKAVLEEVRIQEWQVGNAVQSDEEVMGNRGIEVARKQQGVTLRAAIAGGLEGDILDAASLVKVQMPNRAGFVNWEPRLLKP